MTKERIRTLTPSLDLYQIRDQLTETSEAALVIMQKGALPLGGFYDIAGLANLADKGGTLTMKQLLQILYNLQAARNAKTFLSSDLPELPAIQGLTEVISVQKRLEDEIDRCIISEDEMADSASSELKRIRRSIGIQNENLRSRLNGMITSSANKTLLQDSIVTMRQGRYVIPVKLEHRSRFPGIVHDQSASGATLFIEPQAIVNMNNQLRELELAEKKEMQRILAELSAMTAAVKTELVNNQDILVQLDFIFAKGKLSVSMKGVEPQISGEGILRIRQGRHPLIDAKKVVPINISLGSAYDTLVITGPNTGGKTVTLKTVGLMALMAQSGLHVPCGEGTVLPIYHQVFADIGDEQSIEQSLSTFSSHMNNIVQIVSQTDENTLVLLDELGAGTDPTEGAALAISILENLRSQGASILATTHYTELKKYALSTEGVENASMEFNVETLSPTYRLTIGTPGRSNAFEISRKLGLPESVISHAKSLLDRGDIQFEEVITSIERDRRAAEDERDEATALNAAMKRREEALALREEQLKQQKEKILEKAKAEAREMVSDAKEFYSQMQQEMKALTKCKDEAKRNREIDRIRRQLSQQTDRFRDHIAVEENPDPPDPSQLKLGDRVKILTIDQKGNVLTLPDERGEMQVQAGLMKLTVNIRSVMKIQDGSKKKSQKAQYGAMYRMKAENISPTVNVVGKNLDEAELLVDKYLDDAYMGGLNEVTIIHGRGAGILREGLARMFRSHKHVDQFRKGSYSEGGDGVTVVTLK